MGNVLFQFYIIKIIDRLSQQQPQVTSDLIFKFIDLKQKIFSVKLINKIKNQSKLNLKRSRLNGYLNANYPGNDFGKQL